MGDIKMILQSADAYGLKNEVQVLAEQLLKHFPEDFNYPAEAYQKAYKGICNG